MGAWVFVEGDSEEQLVTCYLRSCLKKIEIHKDPIEFVEVEAKNDAIYIQNCGGVNKIPVQINNGIHYIHKSGSSNILVVADSEKEVPCPQERIRKINSKIEGETKPSHWVISVPTIEIIYWDYPKLLENEIKKGCQLKQEEKIELNITEGRKNPQTNIKKTFNQYRGTYRKPKFAENFFSNLFSETDYKKTNNQSINRLSRHFSQIFPGLEK